MSWEISDKASEKEKLKAEILNSTCQLKNSKTNKLLAVFTLTATTLCMSGCSGLFEDDANQNTNANGKYVSSAYVYQDQELLDDNGNKYTLHKNPNGTETARYEDGKEVTFHRDDDGNLSVVSGMGGLIAGMAAGYFLFHGFNSPMGSYNASTNRYVASEPLRPATRADRASAMSKYTPKGGKIQDVPPPTLKEKQEGVNNSSSGGSRYHSSSSSSSSKNVSKSSSSSSSSSKSSVGSVKSGFGSAGARSAAS